MKVLHTADWHLGKRLEQCERTDEHQFFLDWLIEKLTEQCIDVLIIAGDVFDSGTPSNTALKQYYNFLWQVQNTCCRQVIVIGGNHNSVSTLNAPRDLLKHFQVHVVGGVPENFEEQIIPIHNASGSLELIICAVPFLRDRDVRLSVAGETTTEMEARLKEGIHNHYHLFKAHIAKHKTSGIPIIATGHLFAAGATTSDSEKDIHVGNLGQVGGDQFPEEFDYVALGHLHRPQMVSKFSHIRYSGSPIPLSFSETDDKKQVLILDFRNGKLAELQEFAIPSCRQMIRIKGNLQAVSQKLSDLQNPAFRFAAWVEVQVETDGFIHGLDEQLQALIADKTFVERLFVKQFRKKAATTLPTVTQALALLDPKTVFKQKAEAVYNNAPIEDLLQTFDEAMELMTQQE